MTFARYIAIQLIAYAIDMGGFLALLHTSFFGALYANALGKFAAGCFALIAHQSFTFRVERKNRDIKQAIRYFILLAVNVPLSSGILGAILLFVDIPVAAKFISDVACVALSFFASKMWVFKSDGSRTLTRPQGMRH